MIQPFSSNFSLPDYDFGIRDIYNFPQVQQPILFDDEIPVFTPKPIVFQPVALQPVVTPQVAQVFQPAVAFVPKKTIKFTVADSVETLPGANVAVNGISTAQTDGNGVVTLPNVAIDAIIKITYVGYDEVSFLASQVPNIVIMTEGASQLDEVVIINNYKKPVANNTLLWLLAGAVAAVGIYKYSKTGTKVVQAKI